MHNKQQGFLALINYSTSLPKIDANQEVSNVAVPKNTRGGWGQDGWAIFHLLQKVKKVG